jgi:excinuclease UvrABC helicase subunit UvrB
MKVMTNFKLTSEFNPTKDQQIAIDRLYEGLNIFKNQTLNGITGSGKTFVLGKVINKTNTPTIIVAPNKVLAFQLYNEFVDMFPDEFVGYYVSNYDVYKPTYFNESLNAKIAGKVVVNLKNKMLRYEVKDFLETSNKAILICSSTILFPTFKDDIPELILKNKSYIIRRLHEEKIKQISNFKNKNKVDEANRIEDHINHSIDSLIASVDFGNVYYNTSILSILSEKIKDFYLTDYFDNIQPNLFIDESHLSLLQFRALPSANKKRLEKLVSKGYYINNVIKDNILNLKQLQKNINTTTYVSATPSEYELNNSDQIVELLTRPNNLVDPKITIKNENYFGSDKMINDIKNTTSKKETVFINCLSRKQLFNISNLLNTHKINHEILHFKVKQDKRKEILKDLRNGDIQVILGINMLREGIDVKQCSLVIVEQASRNNFLRTKSCLIQIAGRASRNKNGKVFMCCNHISSSLSDAITEIDYRRNVQLLSIGSL